MAVEAISKFEPHRTMYLGGFDRRGCAASMHSASAGGFTVSGLWSDLADFAVLYLLDADDNYGHLFTTRYLPDFDLTGVVVDFDLAIVNGFYPGSSKFQSVPWGMLSYITSSGTPGTAALNITSTTGQVAASGTFAIAGTPTTFDRIQVVYLGNVVFDMAGLITTGMTLAQVAAALAAQINAATSSTIPLTATSSGANVTIACTQPGNDGNTIELVSMYKALGFTSISPATLKLTGGIDPTSFHVKLDFSAMGLTSLRQAWLTLAPPLPTDSGLVNPTLVAFEALDFSYTFSNWTVTDPDAHTPLSVAGPGSVVVGNRDWWAVYAGSGWAEAAGFNYRGFARTSAHAGDTVTITYACQSTHDLYIGTMLGAGLGTFDITLDGGGLTALNCAASGGAIAYAGRRVIATGVAAGTHVVVLTLASSTSCTFDFLQAAVRSNVQNPAVTYSSVNAACDYDTNQTYQIPPARALWLLQRLGFTGDLDFYAGVFFALNRIRVGGTFRQCTVTLTGLLGIGNSFGVGSDTLFITVGGATTGGTTVSGATTTGGTTTGGTAFGIAVYPADTLQTIAQRAVDGINGLFVGLRAAYVSPGVFTITVLSPINGFTLNLVYTDTTGSTVSMVVTGDVGVVSGGAVAGGQEGTWGVEAAGSPPGDPLNRAFVDYLTDFAALVEAAGQTMTVAFSQELLAPPDVNTAAGAWTQRFADGSTVLTDTGFGSWGAGFVEAVAGGAYQQTGHGYITGNRAHFASSTQSGEWALVVTDANHYTLGVAIANSGGYTPAAGDAVFIDLQTSQCAFNASTVTVYLAACYVQAAGILAGAGLTPWLQFGEILHWFFSETMSLAIEGFSDSGGLVEVETAAAHGFTTGWTAILAGTGMVDGTHPITVADSTHFTVNGSAWPGGSPAAAGTVSGGGMAYYDASQAAAAVAALGRALASFYTQDDDPTINAGVDSNFLAGRIYAHVSAIEAAVLAAQASAKFELLYPLDVNFGTCYYTAALPNPQGGRMNAAVNLPGQFHTAAASGLSRFKMEGLSWQSFYFDQDNFVATARYPYRTLGWAKGSTALLIAWDNGSCPWTLAYLFALNEGIPLVNMWAADHDQLFSWPAVL